MINIRESEIRDEALSLTVAAYETVGNLTEEVSREEKNRLIDASFLVTSLIAEAFKTKQNEGSEQDVQISLNKLSELINYADALRHLTIDKGFVLDKLLHLAEELKVELTELLSAIRLVNAEPYSPKLEPTCI